MKFEDGLPISVLRNKETFHKENLGSKSMRFQIRPLMLVAEQRNTLPAYILVSDRIAPQ